MDALRSHRIAGVAVVDVAASLAIAALIGALVLRLGDDVVDWSTWLLCWTALGVVVHWALGIDTALGRALGVPGKATPP